MKVLHIAAADLWAGAETMLYNLISAQRQMVDVQVSAVLFNEGQLAQSLRALGVDPLILPEDRLGVPQLIRHCYRTIREQAPDIVHTHKFKEDLVGAAAAMLAGNVVCVRTVHGRDEAVGTSWVGRSRLRLSRAVHDIFVRHGFAKTFAVSVPLQESLQQRYGADRVEYIANGVNVERFAREQRCRGDETPVKVGFVGRLVPIKRLDIFLQAAAILAEKAPGRFSFHIYGDGPEAGRLAELTRELGIADIVHFLGFSADVARQMSNLDLLYLTSDNEGLPMVVLEAMCLGVPVVTHAVGELPRVLDHGCCGTLVEVNEPARYADVGLDFLERREVYLARASEGRRRVAQHYSAAASARAYVEAYSRCLTAR